MVVLETAVPLVGGLEEPLISRDVASGDAEEKCVEIDEDVVDDVHHYFMMMGWTLGFFMQCLSLGATAAITLLWDDIPTSEETSVQKMVYWTLFGLSNSWLILFPVVCIGIERSWKESGVRFLQTHVLSIDDPVVTKQTRRMTFVASVRFLVGVVMGCFLTWGFVDLYLHASPAMLLALFVSLLACLTLCRAMIIIYDIFAS